MSETTVIFNCDQIGVSGTTDVHVKKLPDGRFEARVGFAIMGQTQMDEADFEACNHDPFHPEFFDNFASGIGATGTEAIIAMKSKMKSVADSIWAI